MSPLGKSGGRSAGNRLGEGAAHRATPRERDGIDAPGQAPGDTRQSYEPWIWTPRGERLMEVLAFGSFLILCGLTSIAIAKLFGII